ncbi:unnamed protein product [Urochloa decumbens]|uniref:Uncharacterized protein n=1 Tax=Urochloa decumbens TaxID=240449 RepID=A0ABC8VFA5_9POAL
MAARLLLLQLGAVAAASCLCILAAGCSVDAAPPSRGVPAGTAALAAATADGVPQAAVGVVDDDTSVPTVPAPDAGAFVFLGARRLGPSRHLHLADVATADATAANSSSSDALAAAAPSGHAHAAGSTSLLAIFSPVFFVLGCGLFVAGLLKSADLYAAAKARRHKASRVRPLGQDAVDAAAGP